MKINKTLFYILIGLIASGAIIIFIQDKRVNQIEQDASDQKKVLIDYVKSEYVSRISVSQKKVIQLQSEIDSLSSEKAIKKEAVKILKRRSNEKIKIINSANDSLLHYIVDSTLRSGGYRN